MQQKFDLEERTFQFAKRVRLFLKSLPLTEYNRDDIKQLLRASGSVAANYIETNEAISKKDFKYRAKICRKESKESRLFLRLIKNTNEFPNQNEVNYLIDESTQLKKIFSAIINKLP